MSSDKEGFVEISPTFQVADTEVNLVTSQVAKNEVNSLTMVVTSLNDTHTRLAALCLGLPR